MMSQYMQLSLLRVIRMTHLTLCTLMAKIFMAVRWGRDSLAPNPGHCERGPPRRP